ncbi:MAG TPA: MaoC family dehydratase [Ktedonobacteraceae bacterium]|nr:MaoC family dehydratase [Ktedonobacteraceae bacterium]
MYAFEDFNKGDAFDLGTIALIEEEIIAFARRYDPQPFHVSPEQAEATIFGGVIASGWHPIVLFMERFARVVLNNSISLASPGADEIRWLKPVRPGDILTARVVVVDSRLSRSRTEMGIIRFNWEMINQVGERVLTLQSTHFLGRKSQNER